VWPIPAGLVLIPYLEAGHYFGIDIRKEAITVAHVQLAKADMADKNPFLAVSDTFGRNELGTRKFDYIFASQILCHLDGVGITLLLEEVSQRMNPGAVFFADIIGTPHQIKPGDRWQEFPFHLHSEGNIAGLAKQYGFRIGNLGQIRQFGYPEDVWFKTNNMFEFKMN